MIADQLQRAIFSALKADPAVAGGNIYDRVPKDSAHPYITIGDDQVIDDGDDCAEGWEVFSDIHIWSRPNEGSKVELKLLRAEVAARLATSEIVVVGFGVIVAEMQSSRSFRDPDGITEHAVLTFRHVLEPLTTGD